MRFSGLAASFYLAEPTLCSFFRRSIQVPSWNKGSRLVPGKDVEIHLSKETRRLTDWVYDNPNVIPFDRVHQYTLDWKKTSITWSVDGKEIIDIRRLPGGKFVDDALPVSTGSRHILPQGSVLFADTERRANKLAWGPWAGVNSLLAGDGLAVS